MSFNTELIPIYDASKMFIKLHYLIILYKAISFSYQLLDIGARDISQNHISNKKKKKFWKIQVT